MSENNITVKVSNQTRPEIRHGHNNRDPKVVAKEGHIDLSRPHEIIMDYDSMKSAYDEVFGNSIKKYNERQTRKDRRVVNYLQSVIEDERRCNRKEAKNDNSRKPAYESIFKIGR